MPKKESGKLIVYTDGGSRGNPGPAGIGVVICDEKGRMIKEYGEKIGVKTNNEAEYMAVISALKKIKALGYLVKLDTNGTNPLLLRQMVEAGLVDYVAMDIKSPLHTYSATVARPVDVAAIRRSIDFLLQASVPYEFRTTVIKGMQTPEDIEEIGKEIKGAQKYYLQKFISTKILNPQFRRKTTYSDEEFAGFQKKLQSYVTYCGIR